MEQTIRILTPIQDLADRLETAGHEAAAAQGEIDQHSALVAREAELQAAAAAGHLTADQARDLVQVAEQRRVSDVLTVGRERCLEAAKQAEVTVALKLLNALKADAQALVDDADQAAVELTAALVSPVAKGWPVEDPAGAARDRNLFGASRCWRGVTEAEALLLEIQTAAKTTWGSSHIPAEARRINSEFGSRCNFIAGDVRRLRAAAEAAKPLTLAAFKARHTKGKQAEVDPVLADA